MFYHEWFVQEGDHYITVNYKWHALDIQPDQTPITDTTNIKIIDFSVPIQSKFGAPCTT